MLNDGGKLDEDRFTDFANFVGLLNQYSDPALLVSGTYDQQILNFSSGKYAFVTQGSWIGATMVGDDADAYKEAGNFEVGMIPYAFEDGQDTILTSSPSWWSVYKDGNVEAAEAFLQWLTTDEAQEVLVKEAGFRQLLIIRAQERHLHGTGQFLDLKKVLHRTTQVRYLLTMQLEALMKKAL